MTIAVLLLIASALSVVNAWLACYLGARAQVAYFDKYQKVPTVFYTIAALAAAVSCFVWMYRAHNVWGMFT